MGVAFEYYSKEINPDALLDFVRPYLFSLKATNLLKLPAAIPMVKFLLLNKLKLDFRLSS